MGHGPLCRERFTACRQPLCDLDENGHDCRGSCDASTTHEIVVLGHLESRLFIISQLANESYRFVDEYSEDEDLSDDGF